MNEYQRLNGNNVERRTLREDSVTSSWIPPPPPEQRQSKHFYDYPTDRVYKSEITIKRTPTTLQLNNCFKCGSVIDQRNGNEIQLNNRYYHLNCVKCSKCYGNLSSSFSGEKNYSIDQHGEIICSKCQLSETNLCYICRKAILTEKYIHFNHNNYHHQCLNCYQCRRSLVDQGNLYENNSDAYCKQCYQEKFALRCDKCLKSIFNEKYTNYQGKKYHLNCFTCYYCQKTIEDIEFSTYNANPCCQQCYQNKFASKCYQCFQPILGGKSIIHNENKYHPDCFRCGQCNKVINESKFVRENNKPCCIQCHEEYFSPKCFVCGKAIRDKYTTYQGKQFHLNCFHCSRCHRIIDVKETFSNDRILGVLCSNCRI